MRRLRRWAVLMALLVGSIAWFGKGTFDGKSEVAAGQGQVPRADPVSRKEAFSGPFGSRAACEAALRDRQARRAKGERVARGPRVGTWNIRWFPRGSADGKDAARRTDVAWLACTIAWLDVDLLAVQEVIADVDGRRAALDLIAQLDALTGGRHRLELDDCADGRQHVGFLWNEARVTLRELRSIAALNPTGELCGSSLRPGFAAHARFADGSDLHAIALHLDSGETPRDLEHRVRSREALADVVRQLSVSDRDVLVLGDYNPMGCDACKPKLSASAELDRLDATLRASGLERLLHTEPRNRCSHYYRGRAGLLDLAVASASLAPRVEAVRAEGACAALSCKRPEPAETVSAWENLSDHCPVIVQLKPVALLK